MEELLVIKIGGNIIDDEAALQSFLIDFAAISMNKILVHGGGKLATELSTQLGIKTHMVDGRRITDADTIRLVTMTYAGWINKSITAKLQANNCNAIGLCGVDSKLIPATKRPVKDIDYGWVGDIEENKINTTFLTQLLDVGNVPIIAPITCDSDGNLLNVNADTIAQALAQALSKDYSTTLIYCFEKNGLLLDVENPDSHIDTISFNYATELKANRTITDGMIPKTDNAFRALQQGVQHVVMGHASFIKQMIANEQGYGTHFTE